MTSTQSPDKVVELKDKLSWKRALYDSFWATVAPSTASVVILGLVHIPVEYAILSVIVGNSLYLGSAVQNKLELNKESRKPKE
jgi:hypothetical protein